MRHTWTSDPSYTPESELSTQRIIELLQELAAIGVKTCMWTGGEPTVHPDFERLLASAKETGIRVGFLSNGVGITASKADAIVGNAAWIRISLDDAPGAKKKIRTFRRTCGDGPPDTFAEVNASMNNLRMAKRRYKGENDCSVGLACTIQKANAFDLPLMIDFASTSDLVKELGITVHFKLAHGSGKYLCSQEQLQWLQDQVLSDPSILHNPHVNLGYLRDFFLRHLESADVAAGLPTLSYYQRNEILCFTPYLFALIDAFGQVHVCCHLYDDNGPFHSKRREKYAVGSVQHRSFEEVWQSSAYGTIRNRLMPVDVRATHCGECTRHWVPNTVLTRLYKEAFLPVVHLFGFKRAIREYRQFTVAFHHNDDNIWF
jgi:MoaA/NifB/PqqE/SkfB family radical SAM enzyme